MQISSSKFSQPQRSTVAPQSKTDQAKPESTDSVTFGYSNNSPKGAAFFGLAGAVPVVGAATNFGIGIQAGFNDHENAAAASGYGALANLAGTATTLGGVIFGSDVATNVGLALLGASGIAGAYAGFVAS